MLLSQKKEWSFKLPSSSKPDSAYSLTICRLHFQANFLPDLCFFIAWGIFTLAAFDSLFSIPLTSRSLCDFAASILLSAVIFCCLTLLESNVTKSVSIKAFKPIADFMIHHTTTTSAIKHQKVSLLKSRPAVCFNEGKDPLLRKKVWKTFSYAFF